jgi:hypothetical protein
MVRLEWHVLVSHFSSRFSFVWICGRGFYDVNLGTDQTRRFVNGLSANTTASNELDFGSGISKTGLWFAIGQRSPDRRDGYNREGHDRQLVCEAFRRAAVLHDAGRFHNADP